MWTPVHFEWGNYRVGGFRMGQGDHAIVCVAGFGNRPSLFQPLFPTCPLETQVFLFGLPEPLHPEPGPLPPDLLLRAINALTQGHPPARLSLLGYSLGARWALQSFLRAHVPVRNMILAAPEGLQDHPIFRLATRTRVGRALFRWNVRWPGPLSTTLRTLQFLSPRKKADWARVRKLWNNPERRSTLPRIWEAHARLSFSWKNLQTRSREHRTNWHILWGEKDRSVPLSALRTFTRHFPEAKVTTLPYGHFMLVDGAQEVERYLSRIFAAYE